MSPRSLVLQGRTLIATLLADTGRISRGGGPPVFDPATGTFTPAAATVVHEGPCRVRMPQTGGQSDIFGDAEVTTTRFLITFPHTIPDVLIDDVVTITVSDDPHIGGRAFRVVAVPSLTDLMYREVGVEVVE